MRLSKIVITLLLLVGCSGGPSDGPPGHGQGDGDEPKPEPETVVEVVEASGGEVADVLVSSAIVESEAQADLFPIASGTVVSIHKDEGDVVSEGDLLAVIDNVSLDAGAERARADLARQEREYARLQELYEQGAVSERELTEARYALSTARTAAREASRSLGQTRLTAPFDGVVAARDIRVGELASSGKRAFQVVDLTELRVVASLPERDLSRVQLGQPARLVSAYDQDTWAMGEVVRVAPVVDANTGTFRVTIALQQDQEVLRPGQYVSVELEVARRTGVLVIPRNALVYEDGVPIVYRMIRAPEEEDEADEDSDADTEGGGFTWPWAKANAGDTDDEEPEEPEEKWVAERVVIEVGLMDSVGVEVQGGLEPGDDVVVVGQSNLKDGAAVLTPKMKGEREAREAAKKEAEAAASSEDAADESEG